MTAAINDFVKEWSQHFKPNECKTIKLEVIKLCKEKTQLTSLKAAFPHYWVLAGAQFLISSSTSGLGTGGSSSSSSLQHSGRATKGTKGEGSRR